MAAVAISGWRGDPHPFWVVIVVVLVLSFPGDEPTLTARAVARLLGTILGILLFLPVTAIPFGTTTFALFLCLLMWLMARVTSRNYLIGSVVITVFALSLMLPLTPTESPESLAVDRGIDTVVAVTFSVVALWAIRPRSQS